MSVIFLNLEQNYNFHPNFRVNRWGGKVCESEIMVCFQFDNLCNINLVQNLTQRLAYQKRYTFY